MDRSCFTSLWSRMHVNSARALKLSLAAAVLTGSNVDAQPRFEETRLLDPPSAPMQPESGFGGRDYAYASIAHEEHGRGEESYWIFRPEGGVAACDRRDRPPVVFLHGWGAMNPMYYGAWIEHLVRRGHVVVYPRYQESLRTQPAAMTGNVVAAVTDAFARLDVDCPWAVIGHSLGGALSANLAARATAMRIGAPMLVLAIEPGRALAGMRGPVMALADLSGLGRETLLVTVAGDADTVVGDRDARAIFEAATGIPASNKRYVVVNSDRHGVPALTATHQAPTAPLETLDLLSEQPRRIVNRPRRLRPAESRREGQTVDALDYYAFWKLADGLIALAADGAQQVFSPDNVRMLADMGRWSDGRDVAKLSFHAELPAPQ